MTQADHIRRFVLEQYILPARAKGLSEVTVRAGGIHRDMGLSNKLPAVCTAIDGSKFCNLAAVEIVRREGPALGSNVFITYGLNRRQPHTKAPKQRAAFRQPKPPGSIRIDPTTSLVLVSCVKSKRGIRAKARDLYTSTLFQGARAYAEATGAPWYILSSRYGLVHPEEVIAPYEYTLNTLGVADRRAWAERVMDKLRPIIGQRKHIVLVAGARYREFLIEPLKRMGLKIVVPMEGLRLGEQLEWLSEHS